MSGQEILVQSLGRGGWLGQLYSSTSGNLINATLFTSDSMKEPVTVTTSMPRTEISYKLVKSAKDRANILDVSASLSVSIMGGAVKVSGFGKYLDQSDSSEESTTITGVVRARTVHKRLDLSDLGLQASVALESSVIRDLGGTHVITGITYGGTLLGTFTESKIQAASNKKLAGKFSLSALKGLGGLAGAGGSAEIGSGETGHENGYKLTTRFKTDDPKITVLPTTPQQMITAIQAGIPNLSSDPSRTEEHGVPVELTMTPISRFDSVSTELLFRELAEADLIRIMAFHDIVITLSQGRNSLQSLVDGDSTISKKKYNAMFPSFKERCTQEQIKINTLVSHMRGILGQFLRDYRSQTDPTANVAGFLKSLIPRYDAGLKQFKKDLDQWETLLQTELVAKEHGFPLCEKSEIDVAMDRNVSDTLIVALIPESVKRISLLDSYREAADDIRAWRKIEDENAKASDTLYLSFYADPVFDEALLKLETSRGSITKALSTVRSELKAIFLKYGKNTVTDVGRDWIALNYDIWGILTDEVKKTRYVGEIRSGLPHGYGIMKYINDVTYQGYWIHGIRDGNGRLLHGTRIVEDGPFSDNKPMRATNYGPGFTSRPDKDNTALVRVSVFKNSENIDSSTFTVPLHSSPDRVVEKIAKKVLLFNKPPGKPILGPVQRSPYVVVANGEKIESGPYAAEEGARDNWSWPDDEVGPEGGKKRISQHGLKESWLISTMENPWLLPIIIEAIQLPNKIR